MREMYARAHWCLRRVRRTSWLLAHRETRWQTIGFACGMGAVYTLAHGREALYRAGLLRGRRADGE